MDVLSCSNKHAHASLPNLIDGECTRKLSISCGDNTLEQGRTQGCTLLCAKDQGSNPTPHLWGKAGTQVSLPLYPPSPFKVFPFCQQKEGWRKNGPGKKGGKWPPGLLSPSDNPRGNKNGEELKSTDHVLEKPKVRPSPPDNATQWCFHQSGVLRPVVTGVGEQLTAEQTAASASSPPLTKKNQTKVSLLLEVLTNSTNSICTLLHYTVFFKFT